MKVYSGYFLVRISEVRRTSIFGRQFPEAHRTFVFDCQFSEVLRASQMTGRNSVAVTGSLARDRK